MLTSFRQPQSSQGPHSHSRCWMSSSGTMWNVEHLPWIFTANSRETHQMPSLTLFQWVIICPCLRNFAETSQDQYWEMLQVSQIWRLFKLMKWQGFHEGSPDPGSGKLVLFCLACPQPGVNISTDEDINLSKYIVVLITKCAPADQSGKLEIF